MKISIFHIFCLLKCSVVSLFNQQFFSHVWMEPSLPGILTSIRECGGIVVEHLTPNGKVLCLIRSAKPFVQNSSFIDMTNLVILYRVSV